MGVLMMRLTDLYDEYIDRRKLTEQKKPFEYIVPPSFKSGVGTISLTNKGFFMNYNDCYFLPCARICFLFL